MKGCEILNVHLPIKDYSRIAIEFVKNTELGIKVAFVNVGIVPLGISI